MSRPLATLSAATGLLAVGGLGGAALATRPAQPPAKVSAPPAAPVETRTVVIHRTVHVYRHPKHHRRPAPAAPATAAPAAPVPAPTAAPPVPAPTAAAPLVTRTSHHATAPAPLVTRTSQHATATKPLVTRTSGAAGGHHDDGESGGRDD